MRSFLKSLFSFGFVSILAVAAMAQRESGQISGTTTVRLNVEENQLVDAFGEFGICLGGLKGA